MSEIRVVLVDDEPLLRHGLRMILEGAPGISVIGEAGNGKEGVELILAEEPDVVLMDIRMPVMDGIEATAQLHSLAGARDIPVVMLTAFDTDEFILHALRAGAVGFLLKTTAPEALVASVRAAAQGQQQLSPKVLENLVGLAATPPQPEQEMIQPSGLAELSERENEIAQLVAQGLSNAEIAEQLFISLTTVKTHMKHILAKIDGTNRVHIAIAVLGG
ncbi:response regulator transcription factor [Corynebacterium marquesiae]|uniref:Response regulator receiver domain protein n=1 Tax=Corynebacterium tuberculostearicum SK141 TaxID=553206 RepID=C6R698_9CORY|nr:MULTISPECIES: response regulator transcription factor [Corynebacterium]MCF8712716.1 response regulator transcription factor [Corynebacterium parakroppenstedtii]MCG7441773.1 response regulator transcription factor [Corynebacterium sp. ACRPQ]MCG7465801.1 response regulator transcription factor [Corynebacterium sp. ACRPJ]EET78480.1 response regulator receiver domain protein [Corynebacterium tuberculostearicum SK141]MCG7458968.1 response regulator transcription factor [Corynebacterium tuberculo